MWRMNPQYNMIRRGSIFMSEEKIEKVEKKEIRISVEEIFSKYPVDRDRARDVILMEISSSLLRMAASLEAIPQTLLQINDKLEKMSRKRPM